MSGPKKTKAAGAKPKKPKAPPAKKARGAKKATGAPRDPLAAVAVENTFYKEGAKTFKVLAPLAIGTALLAAVVMGYSIHKKASNRYIATFADGKLLQIPALTRPNHSHVVVRDWLSRALAETFQVDYLNYKKQINRSANTYFTNSGGAELIKSLKSSGFIKDMTSNSFSVALVSLTDPVLLKEGNFGRNGYYAWMYQTSGTLTMQNTNDRYDIPVDITVTVSRRNTLEYPVGLGIARIFVKMKDPRS